MLQFVVCLFSPIKRFCWDVLGSNVVEAPPNNMRLSSVRPCSISLTVSRVQCSTRALAPLLCVQVMWEHAKDRITMMDLADEIVETDKRGRHARFSELLLRHLVTGKGKESDLDFGLYKSTKYKQTSQFAVRQRRGAVKC